MMHFQIINPLQYTGWDELLLAREKASIFHTSHWAKVLHDSYGYEPLYFTAVDNGELQGLVPVMRINSLFTGKRGVSLPLPISVNPLCRKIPARTGPGKCCLSMAENRAGNIWKSGAATVYPKHLRHIHGAMSML